MVSIAAFQAVDPGSIPGRRMMIFCLFVIILRLNAAVNGEERKFDRLHFLQPLPASVAQ